MLSSFYQGQEVESKAAMYLRHHGWTVLSRSRRINRVEVDIIAIHKDLGYRAVAFVEVKRVNRHHYERGFPVFSWRQFTRYQLAINTLQEDAGYQFDAHISLIVFDEKGNMLGFFPYFKT